VLHDVKLRAEGKEALHQIDVLIDGPSGQRRVLVECKDYGSESVGIDVIPHHPIERLRGPHQRSSPAPGPHLAGERPAPD
jgi:hypothetical protein